MSAIFDIIVKVEELRRILYAMTKNSDNLLDPKTIAASQMLDNALTEYEKTIKSCRNE